MEKNNEITCLIPASDIQARVKQCAKDISEEYRDKNLLFVGILKGSFVFLSDLVRELTIPCEISFMQAASYGAGSTSSGSIDIALDTKRSLKGYDVIVVEDIIDTGRTLQKISEMLRAREPESLRVITLLDKPSRRTVDFSADESLFSIHDLFVVGYGLDFGEKYRELPYIGVLCP